MSGQLRGAASLLPPAASHLKQQLLGALAQPLRCASASPVAQKVLASLKPGDVLVQNDADGEAGQALIKEAKSKGITTVNVVADKPGSADIVERLKVSGADIVLTESYCNTWYVRRLLSDLPTPAVGVLNTAAGGQATAVAKLLGKGSTLLTVGGKLSGNVPYAGAERKPKAWADYLKEKGITAKAL